MAKKRILVVEDEALTAIDLKSNLIELGYDVPAIASSGENAIHAASELQPDLVLMDITLDGGITGIEAANEIRKLYAIPIIYLSADADISMIDKAKTTEPFGYLPKPCSQDSLRGAIDVALYKGEADARIRESEKRYRELVELAMSVILRWDTSGKVTFINEYGAKLFGYQKDEIVGRNVMGTIVSEQGKAGSNLRMMIDEIVNAPDKYRGNENENITRDGRHLWMQWSNVAIFDRDGKLFEILSIGNDITERKLAEQQIHHLAYYDALTQLPNRRLLNDRLAQTLAVSKRSGHFGAVIFLDMDNFKPLNDLHGHGAGDLLLAEAAKRLTGCLREVDTAARFGGDEFVVILDNAGMTREDAHVNASIVAEKIHTALAEPYFLTLPREGKADDIIEHHCTASIGVALFVGHEASQSEILKWADAAMYQAKEDGRNRVRFYRPQG